MADKIAVFDFSGTLTLPFVAEEAHFLRCDMIGLQRPSPEEHKKQHGTKAHYDIIKNHLAQKFGIADDMKFRYVQNYGKEIELSGKDVKTVIMTDLFRDANYRIAAEKGLKMFPDGMMDALLAVQKRGYKLAIVSGTRTDIITGIFAIAKCPVKFDYIFGQDPVLSRDDSAKLLEELSKRGTITWIIGDKLSDLEPAKKFNAKTIFVTWGHPTGGEKEFADYTISDAKEIEKIIS